MLVVDVKFWWAAITIWSLVCATIVMAFDRRGKTPQVIAVYLTLLFLGAATPFLAILLMPKIVQAIWAHATRVQATR